MLRVVGIVADFIFTAEEVDLPIKDEDPPLQRALLRSLKRISMAPSPPMGSIMPGTAPQRVAT